MLLTELIKEYDEVAEHIKIADNFYILSKEFIAHYTNLHASVCANFFHSKSPSSRDDLVNGLTNLTARLYSRVGKLNSTCRELYKCIGILSQLKISDENFLFKIKHLISLSDAAVNNIYKIIELQLTSSRESEIFASLVLCLNNFVTSHDEILTLCRHMRKLNALLYEPLPVSIDGNSNYSDFTMNSLVAPSSFEQASSSIESFGILYDNVTRLLELPTSDRYFIRKIETGSLVITITGTTTSLVALGKFIDFCFKKYIEYRKAGLEIQTMRQQIINTDLGIVEKTLSLNPNLENKQELIEKASASAFKYFKFNPRFRINETTYDTGEEIPLIEAQD